MASGSSRRESSRSYGIPGPSQRQADVFGKTEMKRKEVSDRIIVPKFATEAEEADWW